MAETPVDPSDPRAHCAICQKAIPAGTPGGQCPYCLFRLASASVLEEEAAAWEDSLLDSVQVRQFGDYQLIEEVARGGMGVVYRAWQNSAQREVAVKMIVAGQLAMPATVARFQNEAAAAARLVHSHIVPVYEFGEYETQHFFSMRFIPGKRNIATWARALPAEQRFQTIALAMSAVARAVAYAHEHGVLHRDLKPSNILIDEHNQPQVTDFGLAKLLDAGEATALTLSSAILGSPSYMAPEQTGHGDVTTATDVYGLGAILFELLSGRPPFTGATPLIVIRRVVEEKPKRLADVPQDLDTLCRKCLAKEPHHRYASAAALADELERFAQGLPIIAEPESTLRQLAHWSRRHPAIAGLVLALSWSMIIGFIGIFWQWRHAEEARADLAGTNTRLERTNARLSNTVRHLEWRTLDRLLESDYARRALAELAVRLRADPRNWQAASYAISLVEQHPFARPVGPALTVQGRQPVHDFAPAGDAFAYLESARRLRVVEAATAADRFPPLETTSEFVDLSFSPDGHLLAALTADGAVHLWQMPEGQFLTRTATPAAPARGLHFSSDGSTLFCFSARKVAAGIITDFLAGRAPARILESDFPLAVLASSADGQRCVGWGERPRPRVRFWGMPNSGTDFELPLISLSGWLDAAGRRAAIQTDPLTVEVWDLLERRRISTITGHAMRINRVQLSPDGERVFAGLNTGESRIFSAATGLPTGKPMPQLYPNSALSIDRTGTVLATGSLDNHVRVWDAVSGEPLGEPIPNSGTVRTIHQAAGAHRLLSCAEGIEGNEYMLQAWHWSTAQKPNRFVPAGAMDFDAVRLSPDGRYLFVAAELPQPIFSLFEVATHRPLLDRVPDAGQYYAAEFSPDSHALYVVTNRGAVRGWSLPDGRPLWPALQLPARSQPSLLSPDGRWMAAGGTDGVLRFVDTKSGQLVREFHLGALIKGLDFTHDSRRVVAAGNQGLCAVWDAESGAQLCALSGHTGSIIAAVFSPGGDRVLTTSYDTTARLWDAHTGAPLGRPMPHGGELSHGAFSLDGRRVATAARDGTARIWDGFTGAPLTEPISRPSTVLTVRFHPDGRRLLTHDFTGFRLWDVQTGEPVTVQYPNFNAGGLGYDGAGSRAAFSSDGKQVVLGTSQWEASIWPVADPPVPVPDWFPEFLDVLASVVVGPHREKARLPSAQLLEFQTRARGFGDTDFYEAWLRRFFGLTETR